MTTSSDHAAGRRPRLHFTAPQAWLNDPHGICWVDGEYHLFYQHNPAGNEWAADVHWGHAVAPDLMRWRHLPIALTPRPGEGCWTGATVLEDGKPVIFYTSVDVDDPSVGRIAVAAPDAALRTWTSTADDVVVAGPPPALGATVFRDPCIFATDDGWTMIVGVGVTDGTGLAVQYSSTDRRSWSYDGVLCSRSTKATDGTWTGSMWECPQLFRVGADWVLAVSVWDADSLYYVAAAVGSYDGSSFVADRWSRLTHDDIAYAMTSFADRDGRPCAMFWLREDADHQSDSRPWAGALSLPMLVEVAPDRSVRLRPHPDVDGLAAAPPAPEQLTDLHVAGATAGLSVALPVGDADEWQLTLGNEAGTALSIGTGDGVLTVTRSGRPDGIVLIAGDSVRVFVDAGIVEVFGGNGAAAFRIPTETEADLTLRGSTKENVVIQRLTPAL